MHDRGKILEVISKF